MLSSVSHGVAGFLSALSVFVHPILTLLGFSGFLTYEYTQYWEKVDWPTTETMEFMFGFTVGMVVDLGLVVLAGGLS